LAGLQILTLAFIAGPNRPWVQLLNEYSTRNRVIGTIALSQKEALRLRQAKYRTNIEQGAIFVKNASRIIVATFLFLAALQAGAQKTSVDWDHNVTDFAQYKTYAWSKPLRPTQNPLMDQRIVAAVDAQLAAKGFRKVETGPEVLVTYGAGVQKETSAVATGFGGWRMGGGVQRIDPVTEDRGTLVVDLSNNKQLIWRGVASDTLSDKPDKNAQKIEQAVEKLFKSYPPKAK
jgi:hypothetical protein